MSDEPKALTRKQQVFVDEYLKCWNAAEAARRAGYSERSAYSQGWENLRKPEIKAAIEARLDEVHMSADEALRLLADMARGDLSDFMDLTPMGFSVTLVDKDEDGTIKPKPKTRIIKKIKQKTTTVIGKKESDEDKEIHETEIELYDAQAALEKILRIHGKFKDEAEPVRIIVEYANSQNNPAPASSSADQNQE